MGWDGRLPRWTRADLVGGSYATIIAIARID